MTRPLLGIVCGMAAEARALGKWRRDPRLAVAVSGGRAGRAAAEARRLAGQGARALLSWGIAGGLDPTLAPGSLLLPGKVRAPDGRVLALDAVLRAALGAVPGLIRAPGQPGGETLAALPGGDGDLLLAGAGSVLLDMRAKAALAATGAAAVDMESHEVAAVAAEAGLPALALRAVSDPAGRALPALAATALDARGRPRLAAVLGGLARRPGDLPALLAAGRDSRAALVALGAAADGVLGALLGALSDGPVR